VGKLGESPSAGLMPRQRYLNVPPAGPRSLALAAAVLTALAPAAGWAAPFHFTPASFQQWLNADPQGWPFDALVTFSNLGDCKEYKYASPGSYGCKEGFARISDAMGSRVCQINFLLGNSPFFLTPVKYPHKISRIRIVNPATTGKSSQVGEFADLGECRWR
jgi:hypothetical protein